jgi:hypothetical protein
VKCLLAGAFVAGEVEDLNSRTITCGVSQLVILRSADSHPLLGRGFLLAGSFVFEELDGSMSRS